MTNSSEYKQLKSKQRVADHGEVFTAVNEVKGMLDLVKQETENIESRFLEPACGTGNFLIEILNRKLTVVSRRYNKSQFEFEKYSLLALSSLYGIDILYDNVIECRQNLLNSFELAYYRLFSKNSNPEFIESARLLLSKNIILGDALTLINPETKKPIIFSEWSIVNSNMFNRRDFEFSELLANAPIDEPNLFSDLHEEVFIPRPIKEFPLRHILGLTYEE